MTKLAERGDLACPTVTSHNHGDEDRKYALNVITHIKPLELEKVDVTLRKYADPGIAEVKDVKKRVTELYQNNFKP